MPTVSIESLAYGGDGVGHLDDGRVVFVRGSCPGDIIETSELEEHGRWTRAHVETIVEPSPGRVLPPCPYAGTCGGCQWQHVEYAAQLLAKQQAVSDAFTRIARIDPLPIEPIVASPQVFGYRNKVELVPDPTLERPALGFHRLATDDIIPVERCLLVPDTLGDAPRALSGALRYLTGRHGDLGLRRVALRVAHNLADVEIALWTSASAFPRKAAASTLTDALKGVNVTSVTRVLLRDGGPRRAVAGVEVLAGRGAWRERVGEEAYTVSSPSFFQVNTDAAENLVRLAIAALEPGPDDRIADVYAGVGTFTLPLARLADEVVAFEGSSHALADLRRNLARADLDADVIGGDAERELPLSGTFDLALVDPPRQGLTPGAVTALASTAARSLVYVSCDPSTLARDARALNDHGYAIRNVTPIDLFPQTYHIETMAVFDRVR